MQALRRNVSNQGLQLDPFPVYFAAVRDNIADRVRCRSSGVEHSLGKGEVESSNLSGSTIKIRFPSLHSNDAAKFCSGRRIRPWCASSATIRISSLTNPFAVPRNVTFWKVD